LSSCAWQVSRKNSENRDVRFPSENIFITGLALASNNGNEWRFENNKEYVYSYSSRMLTGIPELADVYTGIAVNCSVHIRFGNITDSQAK